MAQNKDIENYCCPLRSREDQNVMDTANWLGRGTDPTAKMRSSMNPDIKHTEDEKGD